MRRLILLAPISILFLSLVAAEPSLSQVKDEQLIDALTATDFTHTKRGHIYFEDGTSDGTVTELGASVKCEYETCVVPLPPLKAIALLGPKSIPLLIEHLDDTRLTRATFQHRPVPVGFVALDLLMHFTDLRDERMYIPDCYDDGLGSCVQPSFYFRPDQTYQTQMALVKTNWKRVQKEKAIQFVYPSWWR
jgi:hypothetical protein